MDDSDILQLPGGGELYLGSTRSASWKRIGPGMVRVGLSQHDRDGRESIQVGIVQQGEKAPGICKAWVERGEITYAMFPVLDVLRCASCGGLDGNHEADCFFGDEWL